MGRRRHHPGQRLQPAAARLERGPRAGRRGPCHARARRQRGGADRPASRRARATSWPASPHRSRGRSRSSSAVTAIVLFLTFGSVFLPIKAVLMSLLSITASFGALVWIFQEGNLSGLLDFEPSGTIGRSAADPDVRDPVRPVDGLRGAAPVAHPRAIPRDRRQHPGGGGGDRHHRRDHHRRGPDHGRRVRRLRAVSVIFLKALGFTMALAVLIDATIVRGILVPAFMRVMGSLNWWAPRMDPARRRQARPVRGLRRAGRRGAGRGLIRLG